MAEESARAVASVARQELILSAALRLFVRNGFAGTSIEDIRRASGASVGSIYHHFGGKEEVAAELYVRALTGYQAGVLERLNANPRARLGIEWMVEHHLEWVEKHPDEARFLLAMRSAEVLLASKKRVRALNRAFFREVFGWLERQADTGQIRSVPRHLYFPLVIGPSQELAREWLEGRVEGSLQDSAPLLAEAAWNSIRERGRR
jgi:AcrR family transcriptional regulator